MGTKYKPGTRSSFSYGDMGPESRKYSAFFFVLLHLYLGSRVASRSQSSVGLQRKERLQEVDTLDIRAVNGSSRNISLFSDAEFPILRLSHV